MEIVANVIAELWSQWVGPLVQFVVGLGLVVFVHELGHFLAAKAVGIKVERFALGFGPRLFGFKKGDTDYCVKALPLGGYIKMLGQEDFAPLKDDEEPDPRAFNSKTVGQRLLVISAGVIMNVILAAILFVVVGLVGKDFSAPIIGSVLPHYPAATVELKWQPAGETTAQPATVPATEVDTSPATRPAWGPGLRPGDRVVALGDEWVTRFQSLEMAALLAGSDEETFPIIVQRTDEAGHKWLGTGHIGVTNDPAGQRLIFGVTSAANLTVAPPSLNMVTPFEPGDRIQAVAGRPVEHSWQLDAIEDELTGEPVTVTVLRDEQPVEIGLQPSLFSADGVVWLTDGRRGDLLRIDPDEETGKSVATVRPDDGSVEELPFDELAGGQIIEGLDVLGMIPRTMVVAVERGSRADDAGLHPGDVVLAYGDHESPTRQQFREISDTLVGKDASLVVLRDGRTETLKVRPKRRKDGAQVGIRPGPEQDRAVLADVRKNSPAAAAGLAGGDEIDTLNGQSVESWRDVYRALANLQGERVTIGYRRGAQQHTAEVGELTEAQFRPSDYRMSLFGPTQFRPLTVTIRKTNPLAAIAWGAGETWDFIVTTYGSLRALAGGTVSTETLSGPVGIGGIAVKIGRDRPPIDFVYFIAFISATIAVINFLPLPVVDGGHAVFLLIEKVRGKPLPAMVMNVVQFIGLALLLLVFVLLTWQDIARWVEELW